MEIKRTKFLNENIINSLVISAAILSIIGIALNLVSVYDTERYNNDFFWIGNKYILIACIIIVLIYIVQVLWLQESSGGDEAEHKNASVFTINTYAVIALISLIVVTGFGTFGIISVNTTPYEFFTFQNYIVVPTLLALIIMSVIFVLKNSHKMIIALVLVSAVYAITYGSYRSDYGVLIIPLIYAFAYWDSLKTTGDNDFQNGIMEVLLLSTTKLASYIVSVVSIIYFIAVFGISGINYTMSIFSILALISCILLFIAWIRNSFELLIASAVLEVLTVVISIASSLFRMISAGLGLERLMPYEAILLPVVAFIFSSRTLFYIVSFAKMHRKKNRANSIDFNIKPVVIILIIIAVISYIAGSLIFQLVNLSQFYN